MHTRRANAAPTCGRDVAVSSTASGEAGILDTAKMALLKRKKAPGTPEREAARPAAKRVRSGIQSKSVDVRPLDAEMSLDEEFLDRWLARHLAISAKTFHVTHAEGWDDERARIREARIDKVERVQDALCDLRDAALEDERMRTLLRETRIIQHAVEAAYGWLEVALVHVDVEDASEPQQAMSRAIEAQVPIETLLRSRGFSVSTLAEQRLLEFARALRFKDAAAHDLDDDETDGDDDGLTPGADGVATRRPGAWGEQ
jgi:hypothetical protein